MKEINVETAAAKDDRSFRPSTLAEINAQQNYQPLVINGWNVGCGNSVEDIGIISTCYITLWSFLLGLYSMLLKAALDTDDQATALYAYCYFGVIFVLLVAGSVYTGGLEEARLKKARAHRRAEKLKADGDEAGAAAALDEE